MASPVLKRGIWAVLALVVVAGLLVIAVPYFASTRLVSERIAIEMSRWSGYRVEIGAPAKIQVWPRLRASLADVTFSEWANDGTGPVATAQRIDVELSALDAIGGEAVFSSALVVQPTLYLPARSGDLALPPLAGKGRLKAAIERARATIERGGGTKAALPSDAFGVIRVENGKIKRAGIAEPLVDSIDGTLSWPALNGAGSIEASGTWHGQIVRFSLQSAAPLTLIAGGTASLRFDVEGEPGSAGFDGSARLTGAPFVQGHAIFATKSVARIARLAGAAGGFWSRLEAVSLSGDITGDLRRLKFDGVNLEVDGFRATGAIEMASRAKTPMVSGSLAFESVAVGEPFDVLTGTATETASYVPGDEPALAPFDLDLRLSAAHARLGAIEMTDAAASAQVRGNTASFDLLDSSAMGGALQGGLRVGREANAVTAQLDLRATDIDGGAFGDAVGMNRLVPVGRGSMTLTLEGKGTDARAALLRGDGAVSAQLGPGFLSKFDLPAFLDLCRQGGFFSLDQTANANQAVDAIKVTATITGGVGRIDKAEAWMGDRVLWVTGLTSYADRGLALTGGVGPVVEATAAPPGKVEASFFVGGSWGSPYISPMVATMPVR